MYWQAIFLALTGLACIGSAGEHQGHTQTTGAIPIADGLLPCEILLDDSYLEAPGHAADHHPLETQRHAEEKLLLLQRLDRKTGTWNTNHPRHRLLDALHGFQRYYDRQNEEITRLKNLYKKVTKPQRKLLESNLSYSKRFTSLQHHLASNQKLCDQVVEAALAFYQLPRAELDEHVKTVETKGQKAEKVSVSQALKHVVRDWTIAGASEREDTFRCLTNTLAELFPDRDEDVDVLVPGSGLGRLGHDIATMGGFQVTTNEWSMYMNILTRFLRHLSPNTTTLHPFLDSFSHHRTPSSQTRAVVFPDQPVSPSAILHVEGDFTTVFTAQRGTYDVVLTYFFIDTARNLVSYLDTIKRVLRKGGYWVNLGPLLYGSAPFVQLSLEDILIVSEALGFSFVETTAAESGICGRRTFDGRSVRGMEAVYSFDDQALTKSAYKAQYWVAQLN